MYQAHFGLNTLPFTLAPNTDFFLGLSSHQEALNLVLIALESGDGFIKVVGEVGTGKTLLCRKLLNSLENSRFQRAYIPNPYLNPDEFRGNFAHELGIDSKGKQGFQLIEEVNLRLIELAREGQTAVLIIDEAQAMPSETLEALRLLTNLETESKKLLQVVLFGQPELDQTLAKESLRQLKQRITFSCQLKPLTAPQVDQYLMQRMQKAGCAFRVFEPAAVRLLGKASQGIPRLINILAHKGLMVAFGKGERSVTRADIQSAIRDTESISAQSFSLNPWILLASAALVALAAVGYWSQL